jgi:hypothetical protein
MEIHDMANQDELKLTASQTGKLLNALNDCSEYEVF